MKQEQFASASPSILIMTSVAAEKEAIERGLNGSKQFQVALTGVGPTKAAARTATELATHSYTFVINAGVAGGFKGKADIASTVVASSIVAADLGSESEEGFLPVDQLGLGSPEVLPDLNKAQKLTKKLEGLGASVTLAPILTLATVTGTNETTTQLMNRFPTAAAEAMEGHGVAVAAELANVPVLEVRTISNQVGPRDRDAWRIKDALQELERVGSALTEVWS
ncbi:futalosine hydrolase [Alkalicoccobacillus murimartini]|uniref:Futalosine hydrolase n=1 Tax=Alkalicoccobacillus murimartini TaxID=171685 RepID=A0ABT9YKL8_9BACI|nr:futalosine hydrolase [Alkalicoccobacillus murimartini]MDQ0207762.1 futalosine hydrolase [Alkalicoccobacillus murimartini]